MKQLEDFGVILDHIPLKWENRSVIIVTTNHVMHSRTKYIEIKHPFLRDDVSKGDCCMECIDSEHQLANIFTRPLARDKFF